jgi:hypothetical protein
MGAFLQKILLIGISLFFLMYFSKIILGNFKPSNAFKEIGASLDEIRKIGQGGSNAGKAGTGAASKTGAAISKTASTPGSERAISLSNLSRGNIVSPGQPINGLAPATWFYEGIATVRFLDEDGQQVGVSQMVQQGDSKATGQVPFIATPQFGSDYSKTGFILFEKTNQTGDSKKDAWFVLPITYPIKNGAATSSWQGNVYNTGNSFSGTPNNTNSLNPNLNTNTGTGVGSGSTIPAPQR